MSLYRDSLELHPQYVLENGVDFAHFKFVHNTPIVPVFTRHDFDDPVSYVDFTITFEGDEGQSIEDVKSGVEAINGGLGIAVTKSWGMVDNRTISAITPVDEPPPTSASWCTSAEHRQRSGEGGGQGAREFGQGVIDQFLSRCAHLVAPALLGSPALTTDEIQGFHRDAQVGQAVLSGADTRKAELMNAAASQPIRVFQVATGNVGSEMIKRLQPSPT